MSNKSINNVISDLSGRVPMRVMIVIPFVILVAIAGGLTGYLSLKNGQNAVNDVVSQLRSEVTARIKERVSRYLDKAHLVNQLNSNDIELGQISLNNSKEMKLHFLKRIQAFAEVTNIFVGIQEDGKMYGARELVSGSPQLILKDETTGGALKYFDTDPQGNETVAVNNAANYNPRIRAWYKDAVQAKTSIWSSIYPEFATKALAITAAQPIYDKNEKLLGVLGSTAIFNEVNHFLRKLKIGKTGQTFIMERDGNLVSTSTKAMVVRALKVEKNGKEELINQRINAEKSDNNLISLTVKHLKKHFGSLNNINVDKQLEFIVNGEKQFLQVTPLKDERGLDLLIVLTVPENDYMEQINNNTQMTLWLSILALVLTTFVGLITARGIINPILKLNVATKKFARGHWHEKLPTKRKDELGDLARSFNSMGEQVKQSFAALEEANSTLEERVKERTKELAGALNELKESQAQLVQSEKMASLGQMVAGVAHEINTPLGYVRSNVEMVQGLFTEAEDLSNVYTKLLNMLTSEDADEEELNQQLVAAAELSQSIYEDETFNDAQDLCEDIVKGLDVISKLVLNLKDFSRVDSVRVQNVDMNQCLDSVLVIGHNVIGPRVGIKKEYGELPPIECSPSHINQVLLNIITNASQAVDEAEGSITLHTYSNDRYVITEIEDTGKGIPEDIRTKIFDPFFTTKAIGEGTGLGLSISYQIIEQHEGKLEVFSEVGKGTKFVISLPRQVTA
jgi:signal transduction histidine kinase